MYTINNLNLIYVNFRREHGLYKDVKLLSEQIAKQFGPNTKLHT